MLASWGRAIRPQPSRPLFWVASTLLVEAGWRREPPASITLTRYSPSSTSRWCLSLPVRYSGPRLGAEGRGGPSSWPLTASDRLGAGGGRKGAADCHYWDSFGRRSRYPWINVSSSDVSSGRRPGAERACCLQPSPDWPALLGCGSAEVLTLPSRGPALRWPPNWALRVRPCPGPTACCKVTSQIGSNHLFSCFSLLPP